MADEDENEDKLQLYWEHFFRAETGTYEKSTWLDLFLAEFLIRLNEGADPKELITFCPVSGVVSLVGCELLCGVHRVTSSLHAGAAPSDAPADVTPGGAFSRLVAAPGEVLRRYLLAGPAWKCLVLLQALGVEGLSCCRQLSAVLQWACGELQLEDAVEAAAAAAAEPPLPPRAPPPPLHTLLSDRVWSRHVRREKRDARGRRVSRGDQSGSSSSRSSSPSPDRELPALRRLAASPASPARPARPAAMQREATPRRRDLVHASLSPARFLALATDVLRALCRAESGLVGAEGSQISVQCVEFALRRLRALAADPRPAAAAQLRSFTELLLVALDEALARGAPLAPDPLPVLLELLETATARPRPPDDALQDFTFGVAYAVAAVLQRLLARGRGVDRLREFHDRFRAYAERRDGALLGDALELLLAGGEAALEDAAALAEAIGRLVAAVKRAYVRAEHAAVCPRAQHRGCRAPAASPHHSPRAPVPCEVGLLSRALAAGLARCGTAGPARVLLRVLLRCGTCCCSGAGAVVEGAVRLAVAGLAPAELCLRLVERAAFGEGGGRARRGCAYCSGGAGAVFVQYNALLQPDNAAELLRAATVHLARVAPRCRPDARRELLLAVLYPAFIVAKHRYAVRREDKTRDLTAACLELFALLLDSVAVAEVFAARGGLGYALELAELPEFAERCCAILQVAVAAELARGAAEGGGMAARALLQALAQASAAARELYCALLSSDEARSLGDVDAARAALGLPPESGELPTPQPPVAVTKQEASSVARRAAGAWRACAALAASSPSWRRLLSAAPLLPRAHALLRLALRAARDTDQLHALELAEALLTVHAALGEATAGVSARAGCAAAREAAGGAEGAALRALLEALLRVCTLQLAHTERMPSTQQGSPMPCRASSDAESEPTRDGYEADVETREAEKGVGGGGGGSLSAGAGLLAHPDLCLVVIESAAHLANKAAKGCVESQSAARALLSRLGGVLARHALAHDAPRLLHALLRAARPLLNAADPDLDELQCSVLELVETLGAAGGVEPRELACLLRVLRAPRPPLRAVLRVLTRLAARAAADPLAPRHALPFPAASETSGAALRVEVGGWAPWLQGFALVAWLRAHPPSEEPDDDSEESSSGSEHAACWHVCSVGGAALQLQLWLDGGGALTLRLARGAAQLAGARVTRALQPRRWHCLALNVREAVRRRKIHVQVTVYVDGCECDTVSLPLQGVLVRRAADASLLAGHAAPGEAGEGGYSLAGLALYRAALLDAAGALRRAALGPHAPPARHCLVDRLPPNYAALITPDLLERNLDWERVYEVSSARADELDDALLLTYSAQTADVASLFEEPAASGDGGRVVPVTWLVEAPKAVSTRTLAAAALALGGADALLVLHARVAELRACAELQAAALHAALQLARADPALHAAMYCDEALDMVQAVVGGECGEASAHTVSALLSAACGTASPLSLAGGRCVVRARSTALVLEPRALTALAAAWRELRAPAHWLVASDAPAATRAASGSLWALALSGIRSLLHSTHPQRAFNLQQVCRAGLLSALLTACRERALGGDSGGGGGGGGDGADAEASGALVALCRALLHDPPQPAALAQITDFLVLMHQASDTFVTHSRANFYFLVCAEPREDAGALLPFLRRRSDPAPAALAALAHPAPPDDVKELKGFINMQIKEGRKESISSTTSGISENSETLDTEITEKSASDAEISEPFVVVTKTPSLTEPLSYVESSPSDTGNSEKESTGTEDSQDSEKNALEEEKEMSEREKEEDGVIGGTEDVGEESCYYGGLLGQTGVQFVAVPLVGPVKEPVPLPTPSGNIGGLEVQLRAGLLGALRVAARALSGGALAAALPLPALVVLANARAAPLRAAAVSLVHALHARQPAPPLTLLHLAHQVSLYPASRELAAACAALLTKCDVPLQDQLHEDIWADAGADACSRAAPLLALLSACMHDEALAHDVARVLARLAVHAPARALQEVHAAEALLRALRAAAARQPSLLPDVQELLVVVTLRALELPHGMQRVSDVGALLRHEELSGGATAGAAAREAHCALLLRLLAAPAPPSVAPRYFTVLPAAGSEAATWRRAGLLRAHALLLTPAVDAPRPPAERALFDACFRALLAEVCSTSGGWTRGWRGAGGTGAAPLLQELLWQALLGGAGAAAAALRQVYHAGEPARRALTPADPGEQRKLGVYLLLALRSVHACGAAGAPVLELAITDWAREWAQRARPAAAAGAAPHEAARARCADVARWARAAAAAAPHRQKALHRLEALAERVTESAMQLTRQVVEQQNCERKAFMEQLRRAQVRASAAAARWARVVDALTHERALWHFPDCWPAAWALDEAEGASRVRVRLRRAQLRVPARLLLEGHKHKAVRRAPPLHRVLARARRPLAAHLHAHEAVAYTARVLYVSAARETGGELLLSERAVHFVPEAAEEADCEETRARSWPLERLAEVASRRWCLQERAVELFLSSGHAHLLAFADSAERDAFLKALHRLHPLPGGTEAERLAEAMSAWRAGQLSNWDYLMRLNGLAGRSYNDLMQYPVLPFVLADYGARLLELHEPATFRDLSRPVAVQQPARESHYIATYNDLLSAGRGTTVGPARSPHHYASLYSNSGAVLHYLVRVSPFTELFLNYQDNNFDMPDRTFHSLATTWRLITRDSPTDVKELIPELFYLPELFSNREGLALGTRQCGAAVDAVELPPWAMGDARLFTLAHRQALEAPAVCEGLPAWIDLIFGYKQTGQAAIDALNVFPACTYYGFDPTALPDELERTAAEAMVRTYGQAPRQLLRVPHPRRQLDPLAPPEPRAPPASCGVRGARWGDYCGSPATPPPRVTLRRQSGGAARVQSLPRSRAAALLPASSALLQLRPGAAPALLTWGHADRVLRLRCRRDAPPDLVLHVPADDRVVAVATCQSGSWPAFVGLSSGGVVAVRGGGALGAGGLRARTLRLHAHARGLVELVACARAGLLASAGADGVVVLWDLHRLQYLRTLPHTAGERVRRLAISPTLADVCAAHMPPGDGGGGAGAGAALRVHTCNGVFVAAVNVPEPVTSLCYSNAPEGVSVNCVAAGLAGGDVRLYSSWDLQPHAHIACAGAAVPLVSLCYSRDADVLFGCYADGSAAAWESGPTRSPPRLLPAHALL